MKKINKKTVVDADLNGKKVLLRCDFNVPLDAEKNITDNSRIVKSLETIKYILKHDVKLILCSHLGRPKGGYDEKYSLKPVRDELERLLERNVKLSTDVVGENANYLVENMAFGDIVLLENVRFEEGETKNSEELSKKYAKLADIFVNDAFGSAHRAHSSTVGVAEILDGYAGFLLEKEIEFMSSVIEDPERPFLAILGGSKVSDKIGVIKSLINKVDTILIGGGMSYTFLKAMGHEVGTSLCEIDKLDLAKELMMLASEKNVKLVLPVDVVVAESLDSEEYEIVKYNEIPKDKGGMDIGPKSLEKAKQEIQKAKTIVWNGPVGAFEYKNFLTGTKTIAEIIAETDCVSIIGGGDSAAAIVQLGLEEKFSHISTGGGASLELLEGKVLPGLDILKDK